MDPLTTCQTATCTKQLVGLQAHDDTVISATFREPS